MSSENKYYRFASKLPYIGNVRNPSVSGYWTIWEMRGNSVRVARFNMRIDDLEKYRGKLYDQEGIDEVFPCTCANCGREYMHTWKKPYCSACSDLF